MLRDTSLVLPDPDTDGHDTGMPAPSGGTTDPAPCLVRSLPRILLETVLLVLVLYVALRVFLIPYQVDGASMSPDLRDGERVFVHRLAYTDVDFDALWNVLPWEHQAGHDQIFVPGPRSAATSSSCSRRWRRPSLTSSA